MEVVTACSHVNVLQLQSWLHVSDDREVHILALTSGGQDEQATRVETVLRTYLQGTYGRERDHDQYLVEKDEISGHNEQHCRSRQTSAPYLLHFRP